MFHKSGDNTPFFNRLICPWDWAALCGALLSIATILGFLGSFWWFLDLFSHFRVQYFFGLAAVTLILLFPRRYKACFFFGMLSLVNGGLIATLYFGESPQPTKGGYRSLLMNVNTFCGKPEKVAQTINQMAPDLVVLEEVNDRWLSELSTSLRAYPYSRTIPREDNFGIALYSKHPFIRSEIRQVGEADVPSVIAELELPDGPLTVIATHPLPPGGAENSRLRNDQLARLPTLVKQAKSPVILLGDLNVTPWCSHFTRLLRQSGLKDSSQGRGVLATWPSFSPILLIPIDHCLHSASIQITKKAVGPNSGSDHYPLIIDFVLTARSRL